MAHNSHRLYICGTAVKELQQSKPKRPDNFRDAYPRVGIAQPLGGQISYTGQSNSTYFDQSSSNLSNSFFPTPPIDSLVIASRTCSPILSSDPVSETISCSGSRSCRGWARSDNHFFFLKKKVCAYKCIGFAYLSGLHEINEKLDHFFPLLPRVR